jgi:hypothetical protein
MHIDQLGVSLQCHGLLLSDSGVEPLEVGGVTAFRWQSQAAYITAEEKIEQPDPLHYVGTAYTLRSAAHQPPFGAILDPI